MISQIVVSGAFGKTKVMGYLIETDWISASKVTISDLTTSLISLGAMGIELNNTCYEIPSTCISVCVVSDAGATPAWVQDTLNTANN